MNRSGSFLYLTGYGAIHKQTCADFLGLDALLHSQFSKDWNLKITILGHSNELQTELHSGQGYAVSDGSFYNQVRAATFIIKGTDNTNRLIGTIHTPRGDTDHSAFCSEAAGILGTLLTLESKKILGNQTNPNLSSLQCKISINVDSIRVSGSSNHMTS